MLSRTVLGLLFAALAVIVAPAQADTYPTRPVRFLVVYGPGSGPDI